MNELKEVQPGKTFTYGGVNWQVLEQAEGRALCLAVGSIGDKAFDKDNHNDWKESSLRKFLNEKFLEKLVKAGADKDAFLPMELDLTADDGLDDYGKSTDRIGLISCEQYRKYRKLIAPLNDWWWTITPWFTAANGYSCDVRFVDSGGTLDNDYASYGNSGVRPLCTLNSSISVS